MATKMSTSSRFTHFLRSIHPSSINNPVEILRNFCFLFLIGVDSNSSGFNSGISLAWALEITWSGTTISSLTLQEITWIAFNGAFPMSWFDCVPFNEIFGQCIGRCVTIKSSQNLYTSLRWGCLSWENSFCQWLSPPHLKQHLLLDWFGL